MTNRSYNLARVINPVAREKLPPISAAGVAPGVALAVIVMLAAQQVSELIGRLASMQTTPVSGVLIAILTGLAIRNLIGLPAMCSSGVKFSVTNLLRLGIILVGVKLSVLDVFKVGVWGIPVVVAAIASGLLFIGWFTRILNVPPRLGLLIAAGTSICGITAVLSTAPAIEANDEEVAYAVANVTIFGLIGMIVYPYIAHALLRTPEQIGLFLGTAVHDTSQVIGAAIHYRETFHDDQVLQVATVTKLTRNLFLALVVPSLAYFQLRRKGDHNSKNVSVCHLLPLFILGFVAMAVVRSIGDATAQTGRAFGVWTPSSWSSLTVFIGDVCGSRYLLGTAMAGIGLNTSLSVFRGIGLKPLAVGLLGSVLVGLVGLLMAVLMGEFVHF